MNAKVWIEKIRDVLVKHDPENALTYQQNAEKALVRLEQLITKISRETKNLEQSKFIVFHDAYQYFEERYELSPAGSVTANPEVRPGARRIANLKQASDNAICVFAEPQFEARVLQLLTEDDGVRLGYLDPLGSALPAGPDHFAATLRALAVSITDCLSQ